MKRPFETTEEQMQRYFRYFLLFVCVALITILILINK